MMIGVLSVLEELFLDESPELRPGEPVELAGTVEDPTTTDATVEPLTTTV